MQTRAAVHTISWVRAEEKAKVVKWLQMCLLNCSEWMEGNCEKREQERKEDRGNCLMLSSTLCMRIYLPLSHSHAHISPPVSLSSLTPPPLPPCSPFTDISSYICFSLSNEVVKPRVYRRQPEDAPTAMHAPSDINCSIPWLFPTLDANSCVHRLCWTQNTTWSKLIHTDREQRHPIQWLDSVPSQNRCIGSNWSSAGGEYVEDREGRERVYAEISSDTAFYRHRLLLFPVSECLLGTVRHKCSTSLQWTVLSCSTFLVLRIRAGHWMYIWCTQCPVYNRGTQSPSPLLPQPPPWQSRDSHSPSAVWPHIM